MKVFQLAYPSHPYLVPTGSVLWFSGLCTYSSTLVLTPAPADDWVLSPPRVGAVADNLAELLDDQPSFVVNKLNRVLVPLVCRWVEQVFLSWTSGSPLTLPHWQAR